MQIFCRGEARIQHRDTGAIFTIENDELDWDAVGADTRQMGSEIHYEATIEHEALGELSWNLWEYPAGAAHDRQTDANGHVVLEDFDYGLEHTPEETSEREAQISAIVEWFHGNYEDPAMRTSYNGREGGYLWNHGGPYDARDAVWHEYPEVPEDVLDAAVEEIERDGITEWAGGPGSEDFQDDDEYVPGDGETTDDSIPEQEPGLAFELQEGGLIGILPRGMPSPEEHHQLAALRHVMTSALGDLKAKLAGSNSYVSLAGIAAQYEAAVVADPLSIDLIYALGVRLENARARLQREVESGDFPEMAPAMGESLDSVLAIHGPMILSTERGRQLLDMARAYALSDMETAAYSAAAGSLSRAYEGATNLVRADALEALTAANSDIGGGPHPERSHHVSHTANRNMIIVIARTAMVSVGAMGLSAVVGNGFAASVPGIAITDGVMVAANAAWEFFTANAPVLRDFAAVAGPDMNWLSSLLNRVEALRHFMGRRKA